jgi:hypothetical protein
MTKRRLVKKHPPLTDQEYAEYFKGSEQELKRMMREYKDFLRRQGALDVPNDGN